MAITVLEPVDGRHGEADARHRLRHWFEVKTIEFGLWVCGAIAGNCAEGGHGIND